MPAVKLLAPLLPQRQQTPPVVRFGAQQGRQPGRVGPGRVAALFLDRLDELGGLLAADAKQISHLPPAQAQLLPQGLQQGAERIRQQVALLFLLVPPQLLQVQPFLLAAAERLGDRGDVLPGGQLQVAQPPQGSCAQPQRRQVLLGVARAAQMAQNSASGAG